MDINMTREPRSTALAGGLAQLRASKKFRATLVGVAEDGGYLRFGFATGDQNQSWFRAGVNPAMFAELAREMMAANPVAAIQAFGVVMQDFGIEKPEGRLS